MVVMIPRPCLVKNAMALRHLWALQLVLITIFTFPVEAKDAIHALYQFKYWPTAQRLEQLKAQGDDEHARRILRYIFITDMFPTVDSMRFCLDLRNGSSHCQRNATEGEWNCHPSVRHLFKGASCLRWDYEKLLSFCVAWNNEAVSYVPPLSKRTSWSILYTRILPDKSWLAGFRTRGFRCLVPRPYRGDSKVQLPVLRE